MFIGRRDHSEDLQHLNWRIRLFSIGAGLGLGGIWLDSAWLGYAAIVALLAGMGIRFLPGDSETRTDMESGVPEE